VERAILVRHGESEFSVRGLVNGDATVPCALTPRGVEEARRLGVELGGEEIGVCVTSEFERARQTADIALECRSVPRVVVPELNDPRYGTYECGELRLYLEWAHASGSREVPPGNGEARHAIAERYAAGFRRVLERPEAVVLVVAHSLPIAYVLMALSGREPARKVDMVEHARPYDVTQEELEQALARIDAWCANPSW
jgi:broad specificity phosphatase PhoE